MTHALAATSRPTRRRGWTSLAVVLLTAPLAAAGSAQPPSGEGVLGAACPGAGAMQLLLMPEQAQALAPEGRALTVTGTYTATDKREGEKPKPVGLFLHQGRTISLEYGRMDGLLVIEADGAARISAAPATRLGEADYDLTDRDGRRAFVEAARADGASVVQSHLLIRDGALDLRPVEDAPAAVRRVLFQTGDGALAIWQSGSRPLTLHEAATELEAAHAPVMALNLDMGSYDYCERAGQGGARICGFLDREGAARLSNLLRLRPSDHCD